MCATDARVASHHAQVVTAGKVGIERRRLYQRTEVRHARRTPWNSTRDPGTTGCRMEQTTEEPQGGGLACSVRPEEAEDFAGPDPQIQVVDRNDAGRISLGEAVGFHGQGLRHGMSS